MYKSWCSCLLHGGSQHADLPSQIPILRSGNSLRYNSSSANRWGRYRYLEKSPCLPHVHTNQMWSPGSLVKAASMERVNNRGKCSITELPAMFLVSATTEPITTVEQHFLILSNQHDLNWNQKPAHLTINTYPQL